MKFGENINCGLVKKIENRVFNLNQGFIEIKLKTNWKYQMVEITDNSTVIYQDLHYNMNEA